ncbi:hypothetical protein [Jiella sonneratiae]|uniref:Uncharacterized protein n=1 Tax=Jiella sonneratiae TaxID=2816856 RepID=A0ABS3JAI2_9HYPH|nr:hypothetical protein [Jiella sonneratiae]MBO0906145.1 hypothetical protein [Jiella sonneratiae]
MKIEFRCLPGWKGRVPEPMPASANLPAWLRAMPRGAVSELLGSQIRTVKQCPPFVDAMGAGLLFPLIADLRVEGGSFTWDSGLPAHPLARLTRSPIGVHLPEQLTGFPGADPERFAVKFTNPWTIAMPEGWSMLFSHPHNRLDLPFRTLTGLVDGFSGGFVHFPALWADPEFEGTLPAGTPVAQAMLVRREAIAIACREMDEDELAESLALQDALDADPGVYRKRFRAKAGAE